MQYLKWWLLRTGMFRLLYPLQWLHPKIKWFVRMCTWLKQQPFVQNDFYNRHASHKDHYRLFELTIQQQAHEPLDYFEFGVDDGQSFQWWVEHLIHPQSRFFGFDSFEGLPEDWGHLKKGTFNRSGQLPEMNNERVAFVKGFFADTVPDFTVSFQLRNKKILFLDADLYSSTVTVLHAFAPLLRKGDLLLFDEFFAAQHEFKAFVEFLEQYPDIKVKPVGAFGNYQFTSFEIISTDKDGL
ncbi:MAG: hypothetical protein HEQ40_15495 [Lacibacter sp.]|jgi:O-methyltransferase